MRGRLVRHLALVTALSACAGCGAASPDLFVLTRSGQGAGAALRLVASDGGTVRCNTRARESLPSQLLLEARELARVTEQDAKANRVYPARPGGVLAYRLRSAEGTVRWADTSRPLPSRYFRAAAFARRVAKDVCGLAR
jgi:hypothetical protein